MDSFWPSRDLCVLKGICKMSPLIFLGIVPLNALILQCFGDLKISRDVSRAYKFWSEQQTFHFQQSTKVYI